MLDYRQVVSGLRGYAKPRDRIRRWLAQGDLARVRKGLDAARLGEITAAFASRKIDLLARAIRSIRAAGHA